MKIENRRRAIAPRTTLLASCLAAALALGTRTDDANAAVHGLAPAPAIARDPHLMEPLARRHFTRADADRWLDERRRAAPLPAPLRAPTGGVVVPVTNCDDSGPGSLRDAVDNLAGEGDIIDLSALTCSTITLTTGDLVPVQNDLTIRGPGADALMISGGDALNIDHLGTGTIRFYDLAIEHGAKYFDASATTDPKGGCIYSAGSVILGNSAMAYCAVGTANTAQAAIGGAIYAKHDVLVARSTIVLAGAGAPTGAGHGGAVAAAGHAYVLYSGLAFNGAQGYGGALLALGGTIVEESTFYANQAFGGGGIFAQGNAVIAFSTFAHNQAVEVGAAWLNGVGATQPLTIAESTISGNSARAVGGVALSNYASHILSSTIAFNVEQNASDHKYGSGVYTGAPLDLESSIVTNNSLNHSTAGLMPDDIGGSSGASLTGANNLALWVLSPLAAPADTITDDPALQPLAYNGGLTATHAIVTGSAAIDAGNNVFSLPYDQRGAGFPRVAGPAPDIGAYEFLDRIFANGFEPLL